MKNLALLARCAPTLLVAFCGPLHGQESQQTTTSAAPVSQAKPVKLKNHEPSFLGFTKDSDDEWFLDATMSLQHPLFSGYFGDGARFKLLPYFAATARFGQYIGTRDSSPVVTKRFNPKLFLRYAWGGFPEQGESPDRYADLEYAHESNGQNVDSPGSFQSVAQTVGGTEHAKDYLSRGWDYLGFTVKWRLERVHFYVSRKWYCGCWLQKDIEEKFDFEDPREIGSIRQVSGRRLVVTFDNQNTFIDRAAVILDTGIRDAFKYNTARVEIGLKPVSDGLGLPFLIWGRVGYLSDLAQYYKNVSSFGVAFVFETFAR